jgi:hypothetical protein
MALTKAARNKIFSFVQQAKKLLFEEMEGQLQQHFGIRPDGAVLMVEELSSSDPDFIYTAGLLRNRLEYLKSNIPGTSKKKDQEAFRQLVREQAFTILNRFASLRMAEERDIIRETIRQGYNSEGFLTFDSISGESRSADRFTRYKWYILAIFDELAQDLPALYYRFSPYFLLFPGENALLQLLDIINDEDLSIHREQGLQPVNLWKEDETIGWVYQYYNSREEIKAMRDASNAPRNSRELAVRNQFFTPRYVVQFLTDNSLGRIWYEMTQGQTKLTEICEYLVRQPNEVFLQAGETAPKDAGEETTYIPHRPLKDPREILMLDPACGSMHFGLYAFDLYEQIYLEAWDNHPDLLRDLKDTMFRSEFVKLIPSLIIRHNIHGVDIDPRAVQIAGLSLWLRAQKSYQRLGLQPAERPAITKANLVCAEPMPGNQAMLEEFLRQVDEPLRPLIRIIWDSMKLAGETGMLLKIEEELKNAIAETKEEWTKYKNVQGVQGELFGKNQPGIQLQMNQLAMYKRLKEDFFEQAEDMVLKALQEYAETATNGSAYQKNLFAEDTARGFAFIDLCRKRYDVVLMNPPFGDTSQKTKSYININYPTSRHDLAGVFIERMFHLLVDKGLLGSITTRSIFYLKRFISWREKLIFKQNQLLLFLDLGKGVLDAMVETASFIFSNQENLNKSIFIRLTNEKNNDTLKEELKTKSNTYFKKPALFSSISNSPLCYWVDDKTLQLYEDCPRFEKEKRASKQGTSTSDNFRFVRLHWEIQTDKIGRDRIDFTINKKWSLFLINDSSNRFYLPNLSYVNWASDGAEVKALLQHKYNKSAQSEYTYFFECISWADRTSSFKPYIVSKGGISTNHRFSTLFFSNDELLYTCALWNSEYFDYLMKLSLERVEDPTFKNGTANQLPYPDMDEVTKQNLTAITEKQHRRVKTIFRTDDKSVFFTENSFTQRSNLQEFTTEYVQILQGLRKDYTHELEDLNTLVYDYFDINEREQADIKDIVGKAGQEDEGKILDLAKKDIINQVFSVLAGCCFGRWDMRMLKYWQREWSDEDIFKARKHSPFLLGPRESTLDLVLPEYHHEIEKIWQLPYPMQVLEEGIAVLDATSPNDLSNKLEEVVRYFWGENADTVLYELQDHFGVKEISEIFTKHQKFFDQHLKDYSVNKRISPIYWQLSTPSGSYTVWLYYPKLTNQTLYRVVNDIELKIEDLQKDIRELRLGDSRSSELNQLLGLEAQLKDFKEKLLRIAQLPYQPNHDDGVLITAAPLHELFPHTKWRKATQACWEQLEAGEYDWAHLPYAIWPERVREKCKTDLSMAIAHGLEDICEVEVKGRNNTEVEDVEMEEEEEEIED